VSEKEEMGLSIQVNNKVALKQGSKKTWGGKEESVFENGGHFLGKASKGGRGGKNERTFTNHY